MPFALSARPPQAEVRGDSTLGGRLIVEGIGRFTDDVTFTPSARLELTASGVPAAGDLLVIGGMARLAGTLSVRLASGFSPSLGDVIPLVTYSSHEGSFTNIEVPDLGQGLNLRIEHRSDGVFCGRFSFLGAGLWEEDSYISHIGILRIGTKAFWRQMARSVSDAQPWLAAEIGIAKRTQVSLLFYKIRY